MKPTVLQTAKAFARRPGGFTLVEALVVSAIISIAVLALVNVIPKMQVVFSGARGREEANMQARTAMDTVTRLIERGVATSRVITTPPGSPLPASEIAFQTAAGVRYRIGWDTGRVFVAETKPGFPETAPRWLAGDVTQLQFTTIASDPAIVEVKILIETWLDQSRRPESLYRIELPPRSVRMID